MLSAGLGVPGLAGLQHGCQRRDLPTASLTRLRGGAGPPGGWGGRVERW